MRTTYVRSLCLAMIAAAVVLADEDEVIIETKPPVPGEKYNYAQVMHLSILFFEAQRAGKLPESNRVKWRKDSTMNDGKDVNRDLSGGWYDAGDNVKFGFPMAFSTTLLAWSAIEHSDAYKQAGEWPNMIDCLYWPLDYFVKAHDPAQDEFFVQVGRGDAEHKYWGPPEADKTDRTSYAVSPSEPGSEPAAEAAAAMAAGAIVFRHSDPTYVEHLLGSAAALFKFALDKQATYSISDPFYKSYNGYKDELAWAAIWLYQATRDMTYLEHVVAVYDECNRASSAPRAFGWDDKGPGVSLLMYGITGEQRYGDDFNRYMDQWLAMPRTPKGLAHYSEWGTLRYSANTAFLALVAAEYGLRPDVYRDFATSQIHYILGDCCGGVDPKTHEPMFSYVIGYGINYPRAPHHRGASCRGMDCVCSTSPHPHTLYGAMVGGPDKHDQYTDDCRNFKQNEVATDYNAGLQSAVAALKYMSMAQRRGAAGQGAGQEGRIGGGLRGAGLPSRGEIEHVEDRRL